MAARLRDLREDADQLGLLSRHFFERLFRNDFVDFEDQMKARLVAVLAVLAVVVGWSSQLLVFFKYELSPDAGTSWQEKNYIFILMMLLFGVATLLDWEALFPDRRDFVNLTPLPVRLRTIFAAKLVSFLAFIGLFRQYQEPNAIVYGLLAGLPIVEIIGCFLVYQLGQKPTPDPAVDATAFP